MVMVEIEWLAVVGLSVRAGYTNHANVVSIP